MKNIILINGAFGIGKTYLSNKFISKIPDSKHLSFATKLKLICYEILLELNVDYRKIEEYIFGNNDSKSKVILELNEEIIDFIANLLLKILERECKIVNEEKRIEKDVVKGTINQKEVVNKKEKNKLPCLSYLSYQLPSINEIKNILSINLLTQLTSRNLLQVIGTNIIRNRIDKNYFIKEIIKEIKESKNKNFIIDDWRFQNELDFLKLEFNKVIGIKFITEFKNLIPTNLNTSVSIKTIPSISNTSTFTPSFSDSNFKINSNNSIVKPLVLEAKNHESEKSISKADIYIGLKYKEKLNLKHLKLIKSFIS